MWTCPLCNQKFLNQNVRHSCNDNTVDDFLRNKSDKTISLFYFLVEEYRKLGDFVIHPAKTMIRFAAKIRFAYIHRLGKDYIDVVLPLREPYEETLCFHKVAGIPGGSLWNHYFRLYEKEDLTDEIRKYMKMALAMGQKRS
ncbi:MAG: DUF5655 domain-containing protein [Bacteroidetes bacterium]|nr:DUF5655 domain-containing protein [Bacteroidota bacterium]MDA1120548.1 DUF5655 domain-containing protein [Bacteroidota bacterium]